MFLPQLIQQAMKADPDAAILHQQITRYAARSVTHSHNITQKKLLGWNHPGHIDFHSCIRLEIEIFHQHIGHYGRNKPREFWAESDVFYTEGQ
jgi:hypothetical protein